MPSQPFSISAAREQLLAAAPPGWAAAGTPLLAVVLGSGLGALGERIESASAIEYDRIAGLAKSTAIGHRGEFRIGWFGGVRMLAMAGRLHAYEGHDIETLTRPMALMTACRPDAVVVSCAAGGLNPRFQTGDLVLIDEHLSLLRGQIGAGSLGAGSLGAGSPSGPRSGLRSGFATCDEPFAEIAVQTSREAGFRLHRGTYLAVTGPNYETRAECRMMRNWGMDLVGMSTVPEVVLASRAGMRTLAIGVVTNMAVPDSPATASHEEVIAVSMDAGVNLEKIVGAIAHSLAPKTGNLIDERD